MNPADLSLAGFLDLLAARRPVPGGGAAACVAAAVGCAVAAMAARYTTGKRWVDRTEAAEEIAEQLAADAKAFVGLAAADSRAYEILAVALKDPSIDPTERQRRERDAAAVPLNFLRRCAVTVAAIRSFRDRCNPRLTCDLDAGHHLLVGAAQAALGILLSNDIDEALRREAESLVADIRGVPG